MKQRFILICLITALPFFGIAQKLRIAVAANAQFVSRILTQKFKKQSGIDAELIVSSSGKLTTQIEQGAPYDVFLSADMKYPQELYNKQLTIGKPQIYAYGSLVMWVRDLSKLGEFYNPSMLTISTIKKIAVANPKLAPYGKATIEVLNNLKLFDKLKAKLVYGESIAQVDQYWLTGTVDAAFTSKSVMMLPYEKFVGVWKEVDPKLYTPIAQGIVVLKTSTGKNLKQANRFYKFLFSAKAKQIFKQYGYK
jgi:molybdate transport system substrate-binding protein